MIKPEEFLHFAGSQLEDLVVMVGTLNKVLDPQVMEDVLGPPGVSGEPDKVLHGASRLVRIYEDMLLWAERIRGMAMPGEYREVVESWRKWQSNRSMSFEISCTGLATRSISFLHGWH